MYSITFYTWCLCSTSGATTGVTSCDLVQILGSRLLRQALQNPVSACL